MGVQKSKRPILAPAGLEIQGNSTFTKDIVLSTAGSTDPGIREAVQVITPTGASGTHATTITPTGVTFITSTGTGAGWRFNLAAPGAKGRRKNIFVNMSGASTVPVTIQTAASSQAFFGSTRNSVTMSTVAGSSYAIAMELISKSSVQWALASAHGALASTAFPWITTTASTA